MLDEIPYAVLVGKSYVQIRSDLFFPNVQPAGASHGDGCGSISLSYREIVTSRFRRWWGARVAGSSQCVCGFG